MVDPETASTSFQTSVIPSASGQVTVHMLDRNYRKNFICERCLGCRHIENGNAYNFTDAIWINEDLRTDHNLYLKAAIRVSPWHKVRGWSLFRNLYDFLHLLWLGFCKDVSAQLLYDQACERLGGIDIASKLPLESLEPVLHEMFWEAQEEGKITKEFFLPGRNPWTLKTLQLKDKTSYPSLQQKIKGHASKQIFIYAAKHAISAWGSDSYSQMRAHMAWSLLRFVEICDSGGTILSRNEADEAVRVGMDFLQDYAHLKDEAFHEGRAAYRVRPKLHYFYHLLECISDTGENPKWYELSSAEDLVGKAKRLAKDTHPNTLPLRVMQRRIVFLASRWKKFRQSHGVIR